VLHDVWEILTMPPRAKKLSKKQADSGKRYLVSLRLGRQNRENLERAAAESGRSLGAEAEARLERSFQGEKSALEALQLRFGAFTGVMLLAAVSAVLVGGAHSVMSTFGPKHIDALHDGTPLVLAPSIRNWMDDPVAYKKGIAAAVRVLEAFRLAGDDQDDPYPRINPQDIADRTLHDIAGDSAEPLVAFVRPFLGDLIKRLDRKPDAASEPHS
jgi:hypothetical protein